MKSFNSLIFLFFLLILYSKADAGLLSYYDFIIVGSGASGSVVADRLSDAGFNILVLEAGGPSIAKIDGMNFVGTKGSLDAGFTYTPERAVTKYEVPLYWQSASITGPKWPIVGASVGKTIGGSGVRNGMVFQRGIQADYDNWNVTGWSWSDVLPYFKKVETILDAPLVNDTNRGHTGKIKVRTVPFDQQGNELLQSCNASGLPFNSEFNQVTYRDGCGYIQFNIDSQGERSSSAKEYLSDAYQRSNVDIIYNAQVTRIRWTWNLLKSRYDAAGVDYVKNGVIYTATMRKEVIVAGGALNSPKLLMNSGVGDFSYLSAFSSYIPSIKNLTGVGKNLQNHIMLMNVWNYTNCPTETSKPNFYDTFSMDLAYSTQGAGVFSSPGYSVATWLRKNSSVAGVTENMMALFAGSIGGQTTHSVITLAISLAYPSTTHRVLLPTITSGESLTSFLLKPSVLQLQPFHNDEIQTLKRGVIESKRILSYPPLSSYVAPYQPDPSVDTASEIEQYVRDHAIQHEHWSCTCKMGPTTDSTSVVDPNLRVIGVGKVRVVDGSIMPKITHSLVHATVLMVAEKASDLILSDYAYPMSSLDLSSSQSLV